MATSFEPTPDEIEMAKIGLTIQLNAAGFDLSDKKVQTFMDNEIKVKAALFAQCRWLQSIIHNQDSLP